MKEILLFILDKYLPQQLKDRLESTINGRQQRCLLGMAGGIKSDGRLKAACRAKALCAVERHSFNLPSDASQPFFPLSYQSCCSARVYCMPARGAGLCTSCAEADAMHITKTWGANSGILYAISPQRRLGMSETLLLCWWKFNLQKDVRSKS